MLDKKIFSKYFNKKPDYSKVNQTSLEHTLERYVYGYQKLFHYFCIRFFRIQPKKPEEVFAGRRVTKSKTGVFSGRQSSIAGKIFDFAFINSK